MALNKAGLTNGPVCRHLTNKIKMDIPTAYSGAQDKSAPEYWNHPVRFALAGVTLPRMGQRQTAERVIPSISTGSVRVTAPAAACRKRKERGRWRRWQGASVMMTIACQVVAPDAAADVESGPAGIRRRLRVRQCRLKY